MLQPHLSKKRQARLLDAMKSHGLDVVVIGSAQHVYYFTGYRPFWLHDAAFTLRSDGSTSLACGIAPEPSSIAIDVKDVVTYESNWIGTQRQDQAAGAASQLTRLSESDRIGVDASAVASHVAMRRP